MFHLPGNLVDASLRLNCSFKCVFKVIFSEMNIMFYSQILKNNHWVNFCKVCTQSLNKCFNKYLFLNYDKYKMSRIKLLGFMALFWPVLSVLHFTWSSSHSLPWCQLTESTHKHAIIDNLVKVLYLKISHFRAAQASIAVTAKPMFSPSYKVLGLDKAKETEKGKLWNKKMNYSHTYGRL